MPCACRATHSRIIIRHNKQKQNKSNKTKLAYAIDEERKLQGAEIDSLHEAMEKAQAMVRGAARRLKVVYRGSSTNPMLWVVLFAAFLFVAVFALKKLHGLGRLLFWRR